MQEWFAFIAVAALVLIIGWLIQGRMDARLGRLLMFGLLARIIGSTLRLEVIDRAYGGGSDSKVYFDFGRQYASRIADLDFGFVTGNESQSAQWWGTQFIKTVSGFVVFAVGDHIRAAFLVFSCCAFAGLVLLVEAFGSGYGPERRADFAQWAWLWPSIWFWPSSIGKEAILMLAVGLVVRGYVGRNGAPLWPIFGAGLALAGAVRPHVAIVIALATVVAELMRRRQRKRPGGRVLPILAAVGLAALSVQFGLTQLGLADADLEGIEEYFEHRASNTEKGGSQIERVSGATAVPMGIVNVLFRPFPWEATGISAFSSAEIWFFWLMVFRRRHGIRAAIREWRENRFLVLAFPVGITLAILYGLAFANLGIIARQRVVVLPLMLSLLAVSQRSLALQGFRQPVRPLRLATMRRQPLPR